MKILWFNWRDKNHPDAGGAELYTHEVASRLTQKGHDITLFTANIPNGIKEDEINGVKIVRDGGKFTIYIKAKRYYTSNQDNFDLIVDEINGRPFMTPRFVKEKPIIALFHQSIKEEWFYETFFPLNMLCYFYLEKKWMSYYKNIKTITVSNSSKEDLISSYGIKNIEIAPVGLSVKPIEKIPIKEDSPTIVFIGRMKRHKLPHHAIKAFGIIKSKIPNAKLNVIGDGYLLDKLKRQNKTLDVFFHGKLTNELKYNLLRKAHLILMPSVREGWGLVVTEANAMGTPAVAYNVPGLRDSVVNDRTGVLTACNTPQSLAEASINLLNDPDRLVALSLNALEFSRKFNWDITASVFENAIQQQHQQQQQQNIKKNHR
jgi:glycosyltransferase involved in cell wall biosynthesis